MTDDWQNGRRYFCQSYMKIKFSAQAPANTLFHPLLGLPLMFPGVLNDFHLVIEHSSYRCQATKVPVSHDC